MPCQLITPRLRAILHTLETVPGAFLDRRTFGFRWVEVLVIDGQWQRVPRETIHRLEMALAIRPVGDVWGQPLCWVATAVE